MPDGPADVVLRVGRVHAMTPGREQYTALAIRAGRIVAVAGQRDGLDALVGPGTTTVDDPSLFVYPAFVDTHNHQSAAARHGHNVDVSAARSIAELIAALRERAKRTPAGGWVVSHPSWHETNLAEDRLPTAHELDAVSTEHPVVVRRGGHVVVANTRALARGGIDAQTPDPPLGTVVRDAGGRPTGVLLEPAAFDPVLRLIEPPSAEQRIEQLRRQCAAHNAAGIGSVRDPGLDPPELELYLRLRDRGALTTRTRVLWRVRPQATVDEVLAYVDSLPRPDSLTGRQLGIWGLKLFMDGGVEGGFLAEPYVSDPSYRGHAFWPAADFAAVVEHAVALGWRVGCHAIGDAAVDRVVDTFAAVAGRHGTAPGTLVVEHAFLAGPSARARAIGAGVGITVQNPLLHALAGNMVRHWGGERTAEVMPMRDWLREGALVSAGSDCPVSFFDPMRSMWGMVTRQTRAAGVQGPHHRIGRHEALELYTAAGGRLLGEPDVGTLAPGSLADVMAFDADLLECPIDEVPQLRPAFTIVGGRIVFDRDARFAA